MKNQRILLPYLYALITIVCTFLVGPPPCGFFHAPLTAVRPCFFFLSTFCGCLWFRADVR